MNLLRNFPISKRLWLIPLVAVAMLFTLGLLMIQQVRTDLYKGKQVMTQNIVETARGVLTYYQQLEASGSMTTAEAQKAAMDQVRLIRYGQNDYFWINDMQPVMVMHPMKPELEGQNLSKVKDPNGKELFNEMVKVAQLKGAGLVDYQWAKPGEKDPVPKISYVELFKPWGWIIGSGIYVDDVEAEFQNYLVRFSLIGLAIAALMAVLVAILIRSITQPLRHSMQAMANIASGEADLTHNLDVSGNDELTTLSRDFNTFTQKLRTVIGQLFETSGSLETSSNALGGLAGQAHKQSQQQSQQMELVATAVNEVTYAVQEVAKNAEQASNEVGDAEKQAGLGQRNIEASLQQIGQLSTTISEAVEVIQSLADETTKIGSVLEVIGSIADQTNLLALNAAIEAARAGEQGRGFAVVADEVRQLAQRTASATGQIHQLIEKLQQQARQAVETTEQGRSQASRGVERVIDADGALTGISEAVGRIIDMTAQIASATEQQSAVADEISQNVGNIARLADQTSGDAQSSALLSEDLAATAQSQYSLVERFNR